MAISKATLQDVSETCPICYEEYCLPSPRCPIMLSCGHKCCEVCFVGIIEPKKPFTKYKCMLCRKLTDMKFHGIPIKLNFFSNTWTDLHKQSENLLYYLMKHSDSPIYTQIIDSKNKIRFKIFVEAYKLFADDSAVELLKDGTYNLLVISSACPRKNYRIKLTKFCYVQNEVLFRCANKCVKVWNLLADGKFNDCDKLIFTFNATIEYYDILKSLIDYSPTMLLDIKRFNEAFFTDDEDDDETIDYTRDYIRDYSIRI